MALSKKEKLEIIEKYDFSPNNIGSTELQITLFTIDIKKLTEHFKIHHKDRHSRYGLYKKINKRYKLLKYLKRKDQEKYYSLIKLLGLRDLVARSM